VFDLVDTTAVQVVLSFCISFKGTDFGVFVVAFGFVLGFFVFVDLRDMVVVVGLGV